MADEEPIAAETLSEIKTGEYWRMRFVVKLPMFDPNWPECFQQKWFDLFDRLSSRK